MKIYQNNFQNQDSDLAGLTNLNSGTWAVTSGVLTESSSVDSHTCVIKSIPQLADFDIKYTFDPTDTVGQPALIFRGDGTYNNFYTIVWDGTNTLFYKRVSGVFTLLTTTAKLHSYTASDLVNVRILASGNSFQMKVWVTTDSEPASWQYSFTDATFSSAGYFGFFQKLAKASVTDIEYIKDTTAADSYMNNDSSIAYSPYNWYTAGNNRKQTSNPGAYFKVNFTGTSFGIILDTYSIVATYAGNSTFYPRITYQVDGGAWSTITTTSTNIVSLVTGLSSGSHTIRVAMSSNYISSTTYDRWNGPGSGIRLLGVYGDTGFTISTPTTYSRKAIFFGDSITEGYKSEGNSQDNSNSVKAYSFLLGDLLGVEFGVIGYGSQGWTVVGQGNVPAFTTSWSLYSASKSRLSAGLFSPAPNYIFICHGTNDSAVADATLRAAVTTRLSAIRAAAPNARIFNIIPFNQTKATAIGNGINDFGDFGITKIDLGSNGNTWSTSNPTYSSDGLHPNVSGHSQLANALLLAVRYILDRRAAIGSARTTATDRISA